MPSSIFLSQSIRTFPPSVPLIFPYALFLSFFLVSRFFILFCLPFPVRFPSMLPYSVQFLYSFPFSILPLISSQVPFILLGWFFKTPYKPFAGPYEALKWLKAYFPAMHLLKAARRLLRAYMSTLPYLFQMSAPRYRKTVRKFFRSIELWGRKGTYIWEQS